MAPGKFELVATATNPVLFYDQGAELRNVCVPEGGQTKKQSTHVGVEVFTAVVLKSIIFWDMTPCSPLSFNLRFGGTLRTTRRHIPEDDTLQSTHV
jgi:hypothetical protein